MLFPPTQVCRVACDDVDDARVMAFAWREYANHASRRVFVLGATATSRRASSSLVVVVARG